MEGLSLPHKLIDPVFKAHFGDFGLRKKISKFRIEPPES